MINSKRFLLDRPKYKILSRFQIPHVVKHEAECPASGVI